MFQYLLYYFINKKILGIIENMSYYKCTNCNHVEHIFGDSGAKNTAVEWNIPFLGEIPLNKFIRSFSDEGKVII
jgi:ATP-binding protein involved in chromosome partitioning